MHRYLDLWISSTSREAPMVANRVICQEVLIVFIS